MPIDPSVKWHLLVEDWLRGNGLRKVLLCGDEGGRRGMTRQAMAEWIANGPDGRDRDREIDMRVATWKEDRLTRDQIGRPEDKQQ